MIKSYNNVVFLLIILAILFINSIFTYAQDNSIITIDSMSCENNEDILINVSITNNPGIVAFNFNVNFDKTKFLPISLDKRNEFENIVSSLDDTNINISEIDNIKVQWDSPTLSNITNNGILFSIKFRVKQNALLGNSVISLTYDSGDIINSNLEDIICNVNNGIINIQKYNENYIFGDIDNDNIITANDASMILIYVLNKESLKFNSKQLFKADVDGDGVITTNDVLNILIKVLNNDIKFIVE